MVIQQIPMRLSWNLDLLRARLVPAGIAVHLVDERYSTAEATRILAGTRHEKGDRDALAAALILQVWLDTQRQGKS